MGARGDTATTRAIPEIQVASSLPLADEARALLDRLRRNAEAVLRARGWCVRELVELCSCKAAPEKSNKNVLGWCRSEGDGRTAIKIAIRLRASCPGHHFREFEELMETMLHELSHIVYGPHDAKFFELMDRLREEWEEHTAKGRVLDEKGFPTVGGLRAGYDSHNAKSAAEGRSLALAAAEKRAALGRLMGSGRLGGASASSAWGKLTPSERAARSGELRARAARQGLGDEELEAAAGAGGSGGAVGSGAPVPPPPVPVAARAPRPDRLGPLDGDGGVPAVRKRLRLCGCGCGGSLAQHGSSVAEGAAAAPLGLGGGRRMASPATSSGARAGGAPAPDPGLEAALEASILTAASSEAARARAAEEAELQLALRLSAEAAAAAHAATSALPVGAVEISDSE